VSPDYPIPDYDWDDVPGYEDRHVESVVRPAIEREIEELRRQLYEALARAEKAEARLVKVQALEQRARRELVKRDFKGAAVVLADDIHTALAEPEDGQ
jgi:hypothetical protein